LPIARTDTLLTAEQIAAYESAGYWDVPTFPELLERNARECGNRVAFVAGPIEVTWREVWEKARRLAGHLLALGVGKGDVVGLQLPNGLEYIYGLGAINMVGAVACPHLATLRRSEVRFILGFSEAVVTIVPENDGRGFRYCEMLDDIRGELPALRKIIVVGAGEDLGKDCISMERLLSEDATLPGLDARLLAAAPTRHDVNRLLFTSGSTGDPKGVLHTYATTIFSNIQVNRHFEVNEESVLLLFIPITLNWGMFHVIQAALAKCKLLLFKEFDVPTVLKTIEREKVTHLGGPPTALVGLLRSGELANHDLSTVKAYITSGASCPIELLQQCRRQFGWALIEGYGMTECGWIAATTLDDRPEDAVGTVGFTFPGMEVRLEDGQVEDAEGEQTATEVTMRGPTVCVGYYKNPERNAAAWNEEGWFRSGDLGLFDETGRLRLVGRTKDLIIHGGANVIPREIEELLFTHPKVADVAVIGVPDPYFGENACACVVTRPGEEFELSDVVSFLTGKIAKYKFPQQVERFDALPYTSTGKVQKHVLKAEVRDRAAAPADAAAPAS
jgi:acyl-CoA synthetase (AMP-forming)/AMP-acid ligase II